MQAHTHTHARGLQEAFEAGGLPKASGVQGWRCWGTPTEAVAAIAQATKEGRVGLQNMCWYLDWNSPWWDYYGHDVFPKRPQQVGGVSASQLALILGGEGACARAGVDTRRLRAHAHRAPHTPTRAASMWTEHVDHTNVHCRIWPRAIAVAERFWSPAHVRVGRTRAPAPPRTHTHVLPHTPVPRCAMRSLPCSASALPLPGSLAWGCDRLR